VSTQDQKALYVELAGRLNSPIAFHPVFARITGSVKAALFLPQSYYWTYVALKQRGDGWFWKSAEEWQVETCLTREEQESCRRQLKGLGILREKYARLRHRMYFCIDLDCLCDLVVQDASSPQLPFGKKSNRQSGQSRMGDAAKSPISSRKSFDWNRTETTAKSRRDSPRDFRPEKRENLEKKQALKASRKDHADERGGNGSDPHWRKLRDENAEMGNGKSMEIAEDSEAWKALGLQGPIGSLVLSKSWESRFTEGANLGWPTGKIASEFLVKCRAYRIELPEEFESALVSAIRAEGIPFRPHLEEDPANVIANERNNSILASSATEGIDAAESTNIEVGQEEYR
jgi:hypothetical protein